MYIPKGMSTEDSETLKHLKYNPLTNQLEADREIQTALSSFFLGDQHKMSSGAENIFFTNLNSKTNFFPAWSGLKDHRIVANRGADGVITPSIRKYADMQTLEPYGAAAASGSVAYNTAAALLGNHAVFGQTFIVMEDVAADDWLEYQVWYGTDETGIQAYEQQFTGQAYASGETVDWWFTHPIEGFTGTPIVTCVKLRKGGEDGEATYLQVRASAANAANHYSSIRLREFNDAPIHVPRIGDIKESFQQSDHEGWLLLDGRATVGLTPTQQVAATSLAWGANIPDHINKVSVGAGDNYVLGTSGGSLKLAKAALPNFTMTGNTSMRNTNHVHASGALVMGTESTGHTHSGSSLSATSSGSAHTHSLTTDAMTFVGGAYSTSNGGDGVGGPVNKTIRDGAHSHAIIGNTGDRSATHKHTISGSTNGMSTNKEHDHTFTTPSINGGVTQEDHMVPYMAVNKFVYLGA
jgi:hypothetical protein